MNDFQKDKKVKLKLKEPKREQENTIQGRAVQSETYHLAFEA